MTMYDYIKKRNGVPIGHPSSLKNNLYRAFGAKDFATFWRYWNPIFGYTLGKYVYKPLKKTLPSSIALLITFIFCGSFHDLITIIFRKRTSFFFTICFTFFGLLVLLTQFAHIKSSSKKWISKALLNIICLILCFLFTYVCQKLISYTFYL